MSDNAVVLPCPFCLKPPILEMFGCEDYVFCLTIGCAMEEIYIATTQAWNRRAAAPATEPELGDARIIAIAKQFAARYAGKEFVAKDIEQAIRTALSEYGAPASEPWQPIETAPKDGTRILAMADGDVNILHWSYPEPFQEKKTWTSDSCGPGYTNTPDEVTGWQPLPAAPEGGR